VDADHVFDDGVGEDLVGDLGDSGAGRVVDRTVHGQLEPLADPDSRIRGLSGLALKSIGPKASLAVPQLAAALSDSEESVRVAAAEALGAIGPGASAAVPALAAKLTDKNEGRFVFRTAMQALGKIGPNAKAALPVLKQVANDRRDSIAAQTILLIEGKEVPTYF